MSKGSQCELSQDCLSHCCATDLLICAESSFCQLKIQRMSTINTFELLAAIGGAIFFIFLIVAICLKSNKNWEELVEEGSDSRPKAIQPEFHLSIIDEDAQIEKQLQAKRLKEQSHRKKLRMIRTMRHRDESIDLFFKKKQRHQNESFSVRSSQNLSYQSPNSSFHSQSPLEGNFVDTKMRMRKLMQSRLNMIVSSQTDVKSLESYSDESIPDKRKQPATSRGPRIVPV